MSGDGRADPGMGVAHALIATSRIAKTAGVALRTSAAAMQSSRLMAFTRRALRGAPASPPRERYARVALVAGTAMSAHGVFALMLPKHAAPTVFVTSPTLAAVVIVAAALARRYTSDA